MVLISSTTSPMAGSGLRQFTDAVVGSLRLNHRFVGDPGRFLDLTADFVDRRVISSLAELTDCRWWKPPRTLPQLRSQFPRPPGCRRQCIRRTPPARSRPRTRSRRSRLLRPSNASASLCIIRLALLQLALLDLHCSARSRSVSIILVLNTCTASAIFTDLIPAGKARYNHLQNLHPPAWSWLGPLLKVPSISIGRSATTTRIQERPPCKCGQHPCSYRVARGCLGHVSLLVKPLYALSHYDNQGFQPPKRLHHRSVVACDLLSGIDPSRKLVLVFLQLSG